MIRKRVSETGHGGWIALIPPPGDPAAYLHPRHHNPDLPPPPTSNLHLLFSRENPLIPVSASFKRISSWSDGAGSWTLVRNWICSHINGTSLTTTQTKPPFLHQSAWDIEQGVHIWWCMGNVSRLRLWIIVHGLTKQQTGSRIRRVACSYPSP